MEVEKTFRSGSDGNRRFIERCGSRLVCVRHRVGRQHGLRYATVELIIDHRLCNKHRQLDPKPKTPEPLPVRISCQEHILLRQQVRAAGGLRDPQRRVWLLSADAVDRLNLRDRLT